MIDALAMTLNFFCFSPFSLDNLWGDGCNADSLTATVTRTVWRLPLIGIGFMGRSNLLLGFVLTAVVLCGPTRGRADGLFYELPDDGRWVRFDRTIETLDDSGKVLSSTSGTVTVSSVGSEAVGGEACRWVELKCTTKQKDGPDYISWHKLLVPERRLTRGEKPLDHVVRAWQKIGGFKNLQTGKFIEWSTARATQMRKLSSLNSNTDLNAFLSGPLSETRPLDPEVIESKIGKLTCLGIASRFDQSDAIRKRETHMRIETRLHPDAPFGVVSYRLELERKLGDKRLPKVIDSLTIAEAGNNATTEMPPGK